MLLFINPNLQKYQNKGQKVGTGYPGSKNWLVKEINRGVERICSNHDGELQEIVNKLTDINKL